MLQERARRRHAARGFRAAADAEKTLVRVPGSRSALGGAVHLPRVRRRVVVVPGARDDRGQAARVEPRDFGKRRLAALQASQPTRVDAVRRGGVSHRGRQEPPRDLRADGANVPEARTAHPRVRAVGLLLHAHQGVLHQHALALGERARGHQALPVRHALDADVPGARGGGGGGELRVVRCLRGG